jgi:NAD(P)-dependent dehydrogenase (short-subunit alcohol dehydrogenase family)
MGRLEDRVAVITGAGQGIGLSYAKRFLDEGAKVVVAEINEDRAASAMEQLEKLGDAAFVQTDISDERRRGRVPRRRTSSSAGSTSSSTTPRSITTSTTSAMTTSTCRRSSA